MDTSEAAAIRAIVDKYENPHIAEYLEGWRRDEDDAVLFGDPILSKKLARPLLFDRVLAEKLSLDIPFRKDFTDNQCISSATRQWRKLTSTDVETLLSEIKRCEEKGIKSDVVLSTDEVLEIREADLESFIVNNVHLLGSDLTLIGRQRDTRAGRLDLLFEDEHNNLVVVELKQHEIGRHAINQLRGYIRQVRADTKKEVRGVIVCKDVLPAFADE